MRVDVHTPWMRKLIVTLLAEGAAREARVLALQKLQILPGALLLVGVAEEIRRMVGDEEGDPLVVVEFPAELRERHLGLKQVGGRDGTKGTDELGLDGLELGDQEGLARRNLVWFGGAVVGRPGLEDIADIDLFALQPDRLDHPRQKLAGPANKRLSLRVLIGPRRFADEDQICLGVADPEDDLRPVRVEFAPPAVPEDPPDLLEAQGPGEEQLPLRARLVAGGRLRSAANEIEAQ